MTTDTREFLDEFIDRLAMRAVVALAPEDVGRIVTAFPVVGGGQSCIVLVVEDMIVRLALRDGTWHAEHLIVRGRD